MPKLIVEAQGMCHSGSDDLIIAVEVRDEQGAPVTGLAKSNFKVWMLGHFFSTLTVNTLVPLDSIPALEGMYHLVLKSWMPAVDGTFAFRVRVAKNRGIGQAIAWVVKVGGGPG